MKINRNLLLLVSGSLVMSITAACSSNVNASGEDAAMQTQMPPVPTQSDGADLDLVVNRSCLIKKLAAVQITEPQGDLIAWSPISDELALVQPDNLHWQWYIGELAIYNPNRDIVTAITQGQSVFGDVTWSPDGANLAYVVLDRDEQHYTVYITDKSGKAYLDLFGSASDAATDVWSSKKGIVEWTEQGILTFNSSCGSDCVRSYNYSSKDSLLTAGEEMRRNDDTSLVPHSDGKSGDGAWSIRTDRDNNVWLTTLSSHRISLLLLDTPVDEIEWSVSSSFFAIRTAARILVYQPVCSAK